MSDQELDPAAAATMASIAGATRLPPESVRSKDFKAPAGHVVDLPSRQREACLPQRLTPFVPELSDSPEWDSVYRAMKDQQRYVAAFAGPCGTGKSQLAVVLANRCLKRGGTALHVEAAELCGTIKDAYSASNESANRVIQRYTGPEMLVIDEVNKDSVMSVHDAQLLQRIVSKRYDSLRMTIMITNEKPEQFARLMGERVMSRINDTGGIKVFGWKSFRKS